MDGVGGGIVGHAEVYGLADVPKSDIVAATNGVGGESCLLAVDVKYLAAGPGGEIVRRLDCRAAQREASEDAKPHKDHFSFSASHYDISLRYGVAFGKQHHTEELLGSREKIEAYPGEKQRYKRSTLHSE